jgi:hypothetical protein
MEETEHSMTEGRKCKKFEKKKTEEEKFRFEKKGNKRRSLYTLKIKKHIF